MTLESMLQRATEVVRGKVVARGTFTRNSFVYTTYDVEVSATLKGAAQTKRTVVIPGGTSGYGAQVVAGAPILQVNQEYLFILWTGPSRMTHIIGLSQGLFDVKQSADGKLVLVRAATSSTLVGPNGKPSEDRGMTTELDHVRAILARQAQGAHQ